MAQEEKIPRKKAGDLSNQHKHENNDTNKSQNSQSNSKGDLDKIKDLFCGIPSLKAGTNSLG